MLLEACEWIFFKKDGSKEIAVLGGTPPSIGDDKVRNGIGYEVVYVVSGRATSGHDCVIAIEGDDPQPKA
jgi:hypothetical protein